MSVGLTLLCYAVPPALAQSHTPRNCCVRFVAAVAVGSRNTRYRAVRHDLTRTGLSPAGLHQLWLAPSAIWAKDLPADSAPDCHRVIAERIWPKRCGDARTTS
jgi:hypothetical protein